MDTPSGDHPDSVPAVDPGDDADGRPSAYRTNSEARATAAQDARFEAAQEEAERNRVAREARVAAARSQLAVLRW